MRSRLVSVIAVVASACGRDAPAPPTFTTRDSAGIEIVESSVCSWGRDGPITIDDDAYLSIGEAGDNVPYRFIEITDALTLPDGRIAVAEQGSGQVRVFDTEGTHLVSFGRAGDGDGEFRSITRLLWWEDRLWAFDGKRALMSSFGGLSNVERIEAVERTWPGAAPVEDVLALEDGTRLAFHGRDLPPSDSSVVEAVAQRVVRDTSEIAPLEAGGGSVISFPGSWSIEVRDDNGSVIYGGPLPNAALPSWTTDGRRVYYTPGDQGVFVTDEMGRGRRILRKDEPYPPPTDADVMTWSRMIFPQFSAGLTAPVGQLRAAMDWPAAMPVYDGLEVDPDGNVWAQRVGEPGVDWDVFGQNGACLGTVRMPHGLRVFEIGEDYVLGRTADQSDAERVQLHRLSRR